MSEGELQEKVLALCAELGLRTHHEPDSRRSGRGWPDLVIIGTRVLYRELKSNIGTLSHDQKALGWKLKAAGQDWAVWWPKDLGNGNIERQLKEIA